ncbi:hypothetical protein RZ964_002101 [Acinetobacter baumannii]|uniref:hypothetical protein n=1 Tax=Acinetobacter baumannii TaxID=470 RepID=UPI0029283613|nr:hypothetical protein [Acinetobacter baumannii]ELT0787553.1 hypothetical protein [Acinetobacter baumannii]ELT0789398.1 hypothetical protein [Acinetobacter baumannii]
MWKNIRILCLLIVLLIVAVQAWRDQNQDWNQPIVVVLHPINADGLQTTQAYIHQLQNTDFQTLKSYLSEWSQHYRGQSANFEIRLGQQLQQRPPEVPQNPGIFHVVWWSLKFRFYAWRQQQPEDNGASLKLYLNYYDPNYQKVLVHSTALEKGRIGSVNLFATRGQASQNQVVIVHELLHGFGAKDKYDLKTGQPIYPLGYAQPEKLPLYPQKRAEIMGGRTPLSEQTSKMPSDLQETVIGLPTAQEVGWLK